MNIKTLIATAAALITLAPAAALARGGQQNHDRNDRREDRQEDRRGNRDDDCRFGNDRREEGRRFRYRVSYRQPVYRLEWRVVNGRWMQVRVLAQVDPRMEYGYGVQGY